MTLELRLDQVPQAPMRGRYFVRHRLANFLFYAIDAALGLLANFRPAPARGPIERILVANGAHLGDVILATAVLPAIKGQFPNARIGMLVGSWSRAVVDDHPLVDWVHTVDHWKASRSKGGRVERLVTYYRTRRQALRELRERRYDVAVDLYFYFPNTIVLLALAGIAVRIGYSSGGFGPLLTDSSRLVLGERSMLSYHHHLLTRIPEAQHVTLTELKPMLLRRPGSANQLPPSPYIVVHMGSGSPLKDWPLSQWQTLIKMLGDNPSHRLVFTGNGPRELELISAAVQCFPSGINLCDQLDWFAFVEIIANAELLIGVDSASAHVAAAVKTPSVTLGHGMNNLFLWQPVSPRSSVLRHPTPCAPCYRKHGCATMDCIRQIAPSDVIRAVTSQLSARRRAGAPIFEKTAPR